MFRKVALRDISEGEELLVDYNGPSVVAARLPTTRVRIAPTTTSGPRNPYVHQPSPPAGCSGYDVRTDGAMRRFLALCERYGVDKRPSSFRGPT